jgi:hypothetical protein
MEVVGFLAILSALYVGYRFRLLCSQNSLNCWLTLRLADYRQSVRLGAKPLETHDHYFFSAEPLRSCSILSDERIGVSFTIAAGPNQRSHSWAHVPRHSWPYFIVSDSRLSQPGGPSPGTGWPNYSQWNWFPCCCLVILYRGNVFTLRFHGNGCLSGSVIPAFNRHVTVPC